MMKSLRHQLLLLYLIVTRALHKQLGILFVIWRQDLLLHGLLCLRGRSKLS